ncbi:putative integral membrane zinc-ribbon metal-binding protein [Carex littledalei]|uniref:Putative integral membrane zinc-ribbon metal-binding protein n=1 Tax=Carex littledalei TaxID=544730 RepID=A0A833R9J3_9POAL|nr:putative integral membrane zinc-ribbon metal-binding protein [Carex littledalei]
MEEEPNTPSKRKQNGRDGVVSRFLKGIFGGDDLENKLQLLSKEEASVRARMKKRARSSRHVARNVIAVSMSLEVLVVLFAIVVGRKPELSWQARSMRFLSVVVVPAFAALVYYMLTRLVKLFNERDKNTLERLREDRQAKIDQLKEKTNYYATQQLIQRYDLDPAEKAAAAAVLASKLGASIGDEPNPLSSPKLHRKRSIGPVLDVIEESLNEFSESDDIEETNQKGFEKYKISGGYSEGWLAQIAAFLVGEHPSQCYALICNKCHMHNGLARKEDVPFITYYCPHCHALNGARQNEEQEASTGTDKETPATPLPENAVTSSSPVEEIHENGLQEVKARDELPST